MNPAVRIPRNRSAVAALAAFVAFATAGPALAQLGNPIPTPITKQGLRVEIHDLVQMPSTQGTTGGKGDHSPGARARINFLRESPDGRLFVNDLRGQLYTLDEAFMPAPFVDLDANNGGAGSIFPAMRFNAGLAAGFISFEFHPEYATEGADGYGKFYTIHAENASQTTTVPDFSTVDLRDGFHPVNHHTVVTEWTAADAAAPVWDESAGARRELLRVGTTAGSYFHPYGDLQFNPTASPEDDDYGLLYISGGDWGYINGAGAPQGSETEGQPGQLQRLDTLAGTLIRIDPRSPSETGGQAGLGDYTIPADNPFVDGDAQTFDEVYAFGFRNAHRMAWDHSDGQLYTMSVGHDNIEEIDRITPGGNYGWALREGSFINGNDIASGGNGDADDVFANNLSDLADVDFRGEEYLYPVAQYDHTEGNAIAGGFLYQGSRIPELQGKYVFGDIVNGRLFAADVADLQSVDITDPASSLTTAIEEIQLFTRAPDGATTDMDLRDILGGGRVDLRFGLDSAGEIYIMSKTDGFIRRLGAEIVLPDTRLAITIDRKSGLVTLVNGTASQLSLDGYSIFSPSGWLDPSGGAWQSLADQSEPGWQEASAVATVLSELNPADSLSLAPEESRSLGAAFAPTPSAFGESTTDLTFQYTTPDGQVLDGTVEYLGPEINNLRLAVNTITGEVTLENTSLFDVAIEGYSVESQSGGLAPGDGDWNSLEDQGVGDWAEAAPNAGVLSELSPTGELQLPSGARVDLGAMFSGTGEEDLEFSFLLSGAPAEMIGVVAYVEVLPGDYNRDGQVDLADFTVWRDALGDEVPLGDGADGDRDGVVSVGDYLVWRDNFGASQAQQLAAAPEPNSQLILLMLFAAGLIVAAGRGRKHAVVMAAVKKHGRC